VGLLFEKLLEAAFESFLEISGGGGRHVEAGGNVARLPNPICVTGENCFEALFATKELAKVSFQGFKLVSGFFVNQIVVGIACGVGDSFNEAANFAVVDVSGREVGFVAQQ